jgi:hypothetical protein
MKAVLIILVFFVLSALLIISNHDLALYEKENVQEFFGLYIGWLDEIYFNFQTITGQAVKMDWFPE